jgi:hypothetical protein
VVTAKWRTKKAENRDKRKIDEVKKKLKLVISRTYVLCLPCMFDALSKVLPRLLCSNR